MSCDSSFFFEEVIPLFLWAVYNYRRYVEEKCWSVCICPVLCPDKRDYIIIRQTRDAVFCEVQGRRQFTVNYYISCALGTTLLKVYFLLPETASLYKLHTYHNFKWFKFWIIWSLKQILLPKATKQIKNKYCLKRQLKWESSTAFPARIRLQICIFTVDFLLFWSWKKPILTTVWHMDKMSWEN